MAREDDPAWIYESYLVPAMFAPWAQVLLDLARPQPGEHVLDVACGTGIVARGIAPIVGRSGRTVGLDFDPLMIAMAKGLDPSIEWREGDLQNLPFDDETFDLVTCQQGLQFLRDREAGLKQIHRVLRPGGRAVLAVWTELAKSPGHAILFAAFGEVLNVDMSRPPAWSLPDEDPLLRLFSAAGFSEVRAGVETRHATFPSARRFVEVLIAGASKVTRESFARLPDERRTAFVDDVARRLHRYETGETLQLPMESRLVVARKR